MNSQSSPYDAKIVSKKQKARLLFYFSSAGLEFLSSLDLHGYSAWDRAGCVSVLGRNEVEIKVRHLTLEQCDEINTNTESV